MAGWLEWNHVVGNQADSCGRTILESIWPDIQAIARESHWVENWPTKMQPRMVAVVLEGKKRDFPILRQNEDMFEAVVAGEYWVKAEFHPGVNRFATGLLAQQWLVNHVRIMGRPALSQAALDLLAAPLRGLMNPPVAGAEDPWRNITFPEIVRIHWAKADASALVSTATQALAHYVSGMSHMGNATQAWIRSRQTAIRADAHDPDLQLSAATMRMVWDLYGVAFKPTAEMLPPLFASLRTFCEGKGLIRLMITADQSQGQGFAIINFIMDAIALCPDFNWDLVTQARSPASRALRREWNHFKLARTALIENPWARFSGAPGAAAKMPNLGYLAKRLLSRRGVAAVDHYGGLDAANAVITHKAWIDQKIALYMEHVAQGGDDNRPGFREVPEQDRIAAYGTAALRALPPGRDLRVLNRPAVVPAAVLVPEVVRVNPENPPNNIINVNAPAPVVAQPGLPVNLPENILEALRGIHIAIPGVGANAGNNPDDMADE